MVKIKICGLTNVKDAVRACEYGADLAGFILAEESPRAVSPATVKKIVKTLPKDTGKVGLFKDNSLEEVKECVLSCGLDHVQLHGEEDPEYCGKLKEMLQQEDVRIKIIKTFKVKDKILGIPLDDYVAADYYLFDTFHPNKMGGTGVKFDWGVLKAFRSDRPFFLAGGLTPQNVSRAIKAVHPYGVDVSSGVEKSAGRKDKNKLKEFIQNVKDAEKTR